jgi:hypothetical protein
MKTAKDKTICLAIDQGYNLEIYGCPTCNMPHGRVISISTEYEDAIVKGKDECVLKFQIRLYGLCGHFWEPVIHENTQCFEKGHKGEGSHRIGVLDDKEVRTASLREIENYEDDIRELEGARLAFKRALQTYRLTLITTICYTPRGTL